MVGWSGDAARMPLGLAEHGIIYMLNKMILYSTYLVLSTTQSTLHIPILKILKHPALAYDTLTRSGKSFHHPLLMILSISMA